MLPILIINIYYLLIKGKLYSTQAIEINHFYSLNDFINNIIKYFSIGSGYELRKLIFNEQISVNNIFLEIIFLTLFLILTLTFLFRNKNKKLYHFSFFALTSWVLIFILLYLSPMNIGSRHYILGTPFQYFAVICFIDNLLMEFRKILALIIGFLLIIWISFRISNIFMIFNNFNNGNTSLRFDRSYTDIGIFASLKADNSLFIATDWGIARQIYILAQGKDDLVEEPLWDHYEIEDVDNIIRNSKKNYLYAVSNKIPSGVSHINTLQVLENLDQLKYLKPMNTEH